MTRFVGYPEFFVAVEGGKAKYPPAEVVLFARENEMLKSRMWRPRAWEEREREISYKYTPTTKTPAIDHREKRNVTTRSVLYSATKIGKALAVICAE